MQTSARRSISRLMTNSAFEKFSNFPRGGRRPWRPHAPPTGGRKSAPASTCIRCPGCCTLRCVHATTIRKGHATTTFLNGGVSGEWARPKQFSPEEVCADFFDCFPWTRSRWQKNQKNGPRPRSVTLFRFAAYFAETDLFKLDRRWRCESDGVLFSFDRNREVGGRPHDVTTINKERSRFDKL
jgi:hypothetical protein